MKYCLSNRGNIIERLDLEKLKTAGVEAVELYIRGELPSLFSQKGQILQLRTLGLEVIVHTTGEVKNLFILDNFVSGLRVLGVNKLVIHPCEKFDDPGGREKNQEETIKICRRLMNFPVISCLENLPYDPTRLYRYGDNLAEIGEVVSLTGSAACLDTCHLLTSVSSARYTPIGLWFAHEIEHIHISSLVNGVEHRPLSEDDGSVMEILQEFRYLSPGFDGTVSLEIDFVNCDNPESEVFDSLERLKKIMS